MKRYICAALAAALLAPGIWAVSARAQEDAEPAQSEHQDGGKPDGAKMADRMKEKLGLTDEQAGKLKDAMKAHHDAMTPLGQQMKDAVKKLADQLKNKAADADILASLDALKAARKAMADENEKLQDALAGFLTPTQRGKMAVGMAMRMHREHAERAKGRHDGDDKGGDSGK